MASSGVIRRVVTGWLWRMWAFTSASIAAMSSGDKAVGCEIIEAQAVGGDEAALLRDVAAEAMAQRGVEQMGGAVVGAGRVAALGVDRLVDACRRPSAALDDPGAQGVELAERFRRVLNIAFEAVERGQFSGVADLPAAFAVEGRLVEDRR